jgi:hypothetical protein
MGIRLLVVFAGYEALSISLAQIEGGASGFDIFAKAIEDFPVLGLFLLSLYYLMKWLEKMLEAQRVAFKEIYEGNQKFLAILLEQIERKQDQMDKSVQNMAKEMEMMRATLGEAVNVRDVVDQLMDRMAK